MVRKPFSKMSRKGQHASMAGRFGLAVRTKKAYDKAQVVADRETAESEYKRSRET